VAADVADLGLDQVCAAGQQVQRGVVHDQQPGPLLRRTTENGSPDGPLAPSSERPRQPNPDTAVEKFLT
jgi:hypothetical protein